MIPKCYKDWLKSLSDRQAKAMWKYLDGTPLDQSVDEAIDVIAKSHKKLAKEMCGDGEETLGYPVSEKRRLT